MSAVQPPADTDRLLALFFDAITLKRVPRTGWLLRNVPQVESVADHSYSLAVMTLALADALNASGSLAVPLDAGRALTIAVLHDLAESRLTDLPGPALRFLAPEAKRQAEAAALAAILQPLPSAESFLAQWREYEDASSAEGRLVCDADKLEMMVQCLRYEAAGVRGLDSFWATVDQYAWHYPLCAELYQVLKNQRAAS